MQKYLLSIVLVFSVLFLSGCSLNSSIKGSTTKSMASNIFKSIDGGKSWEAKNKTADKVSLDAVDVLTIAVNHNNGKNVFVGTLKNGILKTEDGGENWSLLKFPAEKVYGLAVDYVDGRIIYASGLWQNRGKIFKSINGGVDWSEIYTAPSDGPLVISLSLDKRNSNIVYATTSDNQIIKSLDAGNSWKNIFTATSPVLRIAIDAANSNLLYLNLLDGSVLRSMDGGITNADVSNSLRRGIGIIKTDPIKANWIYAAGKSGLFRSKDSGNNWEILKTLNDPNVFPIKAIAINPINSNEIVCGVEQATYKSIDGGINWTSFQLQTKNAVSVLEYGSTEADNVYMGIRKK